MMMMWNFAANMRVSRIACSIRMRVLMVLPCLLATEDARVITTRTHFGDATTLRFVDAQWVLLAGEPFGGSRHWSLVRSAYVDSQSIRLASRKNAEAGCHQQQQRRNALLQELF